MKQFPNLLAAAKLRRNTKRLLIGAYGFEDRSLGWSKLQLEQGEILMDAILVRYKSPKGKNKVLPLKRNLNKLGVKKPIELVYDVGKSNEDIEETIAMLIKSSVNEYEEIVIDITALTKYLILLFLCALKDYVGPLRIVYTEAEDYAPTFAEFSKSKSKIQSTIKFPSKGFGRILRARCLSSIRMQGQPVTLVAFTSFNEQLVRHMLGTISPYNLVLINGRPERADYLWREKATLQLHETLIFEYPERDPSVQFKTGNSISTLNYIETIDAIDSIYKSVGLYERLIVAATGSKMQTVGLFFSKIKHPDLHIEYPSPDSYYIRGFSTGSRSIFEVYIDRFKATINQ